MVPFARQIGLSFAVIATSLGAALVASAEPSHGSAFPAVAPGVVAQEPVLARHFPAATPSPAAKPKPKAAPRVHHASPRAVRATRSPVRTVSRPKTTALTPQQLMMRAVARIPGYRTGDAVWALTPGLGNWGLAQMGGGVVYISPTVPSNRMYDVVAHEWSHLLSAMDYGNDVQAALDAMNGYFGGSGLTGAERAADCMARLLGATWTHYTPCTDARWRDGARRLLARQRL